MGNVGSVAATSGCRRSGGACVPVLVPATPAAAAFSIARTFPPPSATSCSLSRESRRYSRRSDCRVNSSATGPGDSVIERRIHDSDGTAEMED